MYQLGKKQGGFLKELPTNSIIIKGAGRRGALIAKDILGDSSHPRAAVS